MRKARLQGTRVAGLAALAVVLVAAGAVAVVLSSRSASGQPRPQATQSPRPQLPSRAIVAANLAAIWVAGQVNHDAFVACDKAMCDALTAHGFPDRNLQLIGPSSPYPLHAQVVVETPAVHRQFGSSLATEWAPAVLTRVGSGNTAINIRIVSPTGAAAYESALSTDVRQRKAGAHLLLVSSRVKASAQVRKELADGLVDTRVMVVLTALAAVQPIEILDFGTAFPGSSAGIPLRVADLADSDAVSGLDSSSYLQYLRSQLNAQPNPYRPQASGLSHDGAGKLVFRISFSAPSPLLLFGGQGP